MTTPTKLNFVDDYNPIRGVHKTIDIVSEDKIVRTITITPKTTIKSLVEEVPYDFHLFLNSDTILYPEDIALYMDSNETLSSVWDLINEPSIVIVQSRSLINSIYFNRIHLVKHILTRGLLEKFIIGDVIKSGEALELAIALDRTEIIDMLNTIPNKFNECLQSLTKQMDLPIDTILYHGSPHLITDGILKQNTFLSSRLRYPAHWAKKKMGNSRYIYKYRVIEAPHLIVLDNNIEYECQNNVCAGAGAAKNKKCDYNYQCVEAPGISILNAFNKCHNVSKNVINQDTFLEFLCMFTYNDGYKWTQHEHEYTFCDPMRFLQFEGVSTYQPGINHIRNLDKDGQTTDENRDLITLAETPDINFYSNWLYL